jgi:hypothetical protein
MLHRRPQRAHRARGTGCGRERPPFPGRSRQRQFSDDTTSGSYEFEPRTGLTVSGGDTHHQDATACTGRGADGWLTRGGAGLGGSSRRRCRQWILGAWQRAAWSARSPTLGPLNQLGSGYSGSERGSAGESVGGTGGRTTCIDRPTALTMSMLRAGTSAPDKACHRTQAWMPASTGRTASCSSASGPTCTTLRPTIRRPTLAVGRPRSMPTRCIIAMGHRRTPMN